MATGGLRRLSLMKQDSADTILLEKKGWREQPLLENIPGLTVLPNILVQFYSRLSLLFLVNLHQLG